MANSGIVGGTTSTPGEFPAVSPTVYINGSISDEYTCMQIEKNSGIVPSKAMLRWGPEFLENDKEEYSPITLNAIASQFGDPIKDHGSRVIVIANDSILFAGNLVRRMDNGQADQVLWTALDDRELVAKIPIRGAVVRDNEKTGTKYAVNFLPRYSAHVNPNGLWNCIGWKCDIAGHPQFDQVVPVFTSRAYIKKSYESPDEVFPERVTEDQVTAWTPRMFLQYLYFILHLDHGEMNGIPSKKDVSNPVWRSLDRNNKFTFFEWNYDTVSGLIGKDPSGEGLDPLDRKMPDIEFQGKAALQAISETLTTAGTHDIVFNPQSITEDTASESGATVKTFTGLAKTRIEFFPIGLTGANSGETTSKTIPLMRGGSISNLPNIYTAFDFQLSEDVTYTRTACMVEGDVIRTETRVTYDAGLKKAWIDAEETAFKQVIAGGEAIGATIAYAKYPQNLNINNSDIPAINDDKNPWVLADGQGNHELAYANSPEAVQLARRLFPRVFRAFKIDSEDPEVTAALDGYEDAYADTSLYPQAKINRPVLPNQLQFQLANLAKVADEENKLAARMPIRVSIKNDTGSGATAWQSVGWTNANMIGEGVFLIDMAEQFDNKPQCIYSGKLYASGGLDLPDSISCAMKEVRINIAMPMDHRVFAYSESSGSFDDLGQQDFLAINDNYLNATGGQAYIYIDSGGSYKEEHQINSYPTDDNTALNRLLPPGSEAENAEYAAKRRKYQTQRIDRKSSWKLIGIRPEWRVGNWVESIDQFSLSSTGQRLQYGAPYKINGPVQSIVFDFDAQVTTLGGIIGEAI